MAEIIPSAGMRIGIGLSAWLRILDFRGRSTRTEIFCFYVVTMLLGIAILLILSLAGAFDLDDVLREIVMDRVLRAELISALSFLPFLPVFALMARRLHDLGAPGWPGAALVLAGVVLGAWNDLHFRTGGAIAALPGIIQILRMLCVFGIFAIVLLPPQRRANRYGPDPRLERETEVHWVAPQSL